MKYIGAHVSIAGGVQNAPLNAAAIGATAFAMFTKNQRQWNAKPYSEEEISGFKRNMASCGFSPKHVLPHAGYLINLGNPDTEKRKRSLDALIDEMQRCRQLGLTMLNIHPGSHLRQISETDCIQLIADSINAAHTEVPDVAIVLENTAGQGSNLGSSYEELAQMIDLVENKSLVGVCFDTCHGFAAGYEIDTRDGFLRTFDDFDRIIGMKHLKGIHLNDCRFERGSHKDRHANLGHGYIPIETMQWIMNDDRFDNIPLTLETSDSDLWADEIKMLYGFNPNTIPRKK